MDTLKTLSRSEEPATTLARMMPQDVPHVDERSEAKLLWNRRRNSYVALRKLADAMPVGTPGEDKAIDDWCDAFDLLVDKTPAPNGEALAQKLLLCGERYDGFTLPAETLARLIEDAESLEQHGICNMVSEALDVPKVVTREQWDVAVKAWEAAKSHAEAGEADEADDVDERWSAVTARLDILLRMDAPDTEAFLFKMVQLWGEDVADPDGTCIADYGREWFVPFYNDAFRLLRKSRELRR